MQDCIIPHISGSALPLVEAYIKDELPDNETKVTTDINLNESVVTVRDVPFTETELLNAFVDYVMSVPAYR